MFGTQSYDDPLVGAVETGSPEYMIDAAREYEPAELSDMVERLAATYELKQAVNAYERDINRQQLESYGSLVRDTATSTVESAGDVVRTFVGKTGETIQEAMEQVGIVGETAADAAGRTGTETVTALGDVSESAIDSWYDARITRENGRQELETVKTS